MLDVHVFHDDMNIMTFIYGRKYRDSEHKKKATATGLFITRWYSETPLFISKFIYVLE